MSMKAMPFAYVLGAVLLAALPALAQGSSSSDSGTSSKATTGGGKSDKARSSGATDKSDKKKTDSTKADSGQASTTADKTKKKTDSAKPDGTKAGGGTDKKDKKKKPDSSSPDGDKGSTGTDNATTGDTAAAVAADTSTPPAPAGDADKPKEKAEVNAAPAVDPDDPFEDPNKTYRFIGLRYRDAVIPQFMLNWFASGGRNVNVPMVGPVYTTRKDHVEYDVALMYADYGMDPFLFKGKTDPPSSYELVQSQLKLFYLMLDILYEIPLETKAEKTGRFALLVGGGVGLAIVAGDLYRAQAYPLNGNANSDPSNPSLWAACTPTQNVPGGIYGGFCDSTRNNYVATSSGNLTTARNEPSWFNGGSKPVIFPWIALPQISFRYKPIKQLETKLDLGFSTSGFFFGLSAAYGL
jgi:hypothetical protein